MTIDSLVGGHDERTGVRGPRPPLPRRYPRRRSAVLYFVAQPRWLPRRASRWNGTNANRLQFQGMNALSYWPRNRLLLALPPGNLARLVPELEYIRCQREQVLMDADSSLDHVSFQITVLSRWSRFMRTAASLRLQRSVERVARVCKQAFFSAETSSVRLLVQVPGSTAKMSRAALIGAMGSMPSFRNLTCRNRGACRAGTTVRIRRRGSR
jgi:hypothetical protein